MGIVRGSAGGRVLTDENTLGVFRSFRRSTKSPIGRDHPEALLLPFDSTLYLAQITCATMLLFKEVANIGLVRSLLACSSLEKSVRSIEPSDQ